MGSHVVNTYFTPKSVVVYNTTPGTLYYQAGAFTSPYPMATARQIPAGSNLPFEYTLSEQSFTIWWKFDSATTEIINFTVYWNNQLLQASAAVSQIIVNGTPNFVIQNATTSPGNIQPGQGAYDSAAYPSSISDATGSANLYGDSRGQLSVTVSVLPSSNYVKQLSTIVTNLSASVSDPLNTTSFYSFDYIYLYNGSGNIDGQAPQISYASTAPTSISNPGPFSFLDNFLDGVPNNGISIQFIFTIANTGGASTTATVTLSATVSGYAVESSSTPPSKVGVVS